MDVGMLWKIAATVVGGLGVFLLGMKYMSEGLQAVSGDRLRKIIRIATNNRVSHAQRCLRRQAISSQ